MTTTLDNIMEQASQALAELDYPGCETLCLQALSQARERGDWAGYSRVVLPLQEARRQKRQAALDGPIALGTANHTGESNTLIDGLNAGALVVTSPLTPDDADRLDRTARESGRAIEILFAQPDADGQFWAVHTYRGQLYQALRPAPPTDMQGRALPGQDALPGSKLTPAHWFMQASEALGNTAIAMAAEPMDAIDRVALLEQALSAVGDHELLHQRLADAARAMHDGGPA